MALPLLHTTPVECLVMEGRITKRNAALVRACPGGCFASAMREEQEGDAWLTAVRGIVARRRRRVFG
jgi:hypothetical protein